MKPLFSILIFCSFNLFGSVFELPDLVRESDQVWDVSLSSDHSEFQQIGNYALGAHGAFNLVNENNADFRVAINRSLNNGCLLKIFSNQVLVFEANVGTSFDYPTFLKAMDYAVEYIGRSANLKGFYSGSLAFLGERTGATELYVSDLFFRTIKPFTQDKALLMRPKWSPDGGHLVFTSYYKSGFPDLFIMDLMTKERTTLAAFQGANAGGVISPDGNEVAMTLSVEGNSDLYRIHIGSRKLSRILQTSALESSPSWSPDGSQLVFVSDRSGKPQLYTIKKNGGSMNRLKTNISNNCTEPDWNPLNSDLILFTASVGGTFQIVEYSFKKSKSRVLTNTPGGAVEPCWLSDGRHAIFTERINNQTRLMLLDTLSKKVSALHSLKFGNVSGGDYFNGTVY